MATEFKDVEARLWKAAGSLRANSSRRSSESLGSSLFQRQVPDTRFAYDELIENDTRRNAILEEMAQRFHREWFAHFCHPGHEAVSRIESDLCPIQEGWTVGLFIAIASFSIVTTNPAKLGGELVQHFSFPAFESRSLLVVESPPGSAIEQFSELAAPILRMVSTLIVEIDRLSKLQKILLSRMLTMDVPFEQARI